MKALLAFALIVIVAIGMIHPQGALAGSWDTENFDGGSGSTSNTTVDTSSSVPDIGPSGPVGYYDADMNYHSTS